MTTSAHRIGLLLALLLLSLGSFAAAQEPASRQPAPGVTRTVLVDNDRVLVVENRYEPGAASPRHTHAYPRAVYVVDGGTLELVADDGSVSQVEVEAGMALWRPAETHVVRNAGSTPVTVVETEVKNGAGRERRDDP